MFNCFLPLLELAEGLLGFSELLQRGLGCGLIIPEIWLSGGVLKVMNLGLQCRWVKDSPGSDPGDRATGKNRV